MNANVENVIIMDGSVLNDTKSKRVVKPKLSSKYEKYLVFGYWYSNMLFELGSIDNLVITAMLDKLRMYESLENQTALFDTFELESAATQKTVRKLISDYHKPSKVSRVSKKPAVSSDSVSGETKKSRKKKAAQVVVDKNDDFINQLVAAANTNESATELQSSTIDAETVIQTVEVSQNIQSSEINILSTGSPKKLTTVKEWEKFSKNVDKLVKDKAKDAEKLAKEAKKQAEKLEKEAKKQAEKLVKEAKKDAEKLAKEEVKTKAKPRTKSPSKKETEGGVANKEVKTKPDAKKEPKEKKTSAKKAAIPLVAEVVQENIVIVQEQNDDDDDSHHTRKLEESDNEEEIHAREFIFNGKKYLIDEKTSELYDIETQDLIGKFDSETNTINSI